MSAKKYVSCFLITFYTFMTLNLVLWHGFIKNGFMHRDFNRMGYFIDIKSKTPEAHYSKHHIELRDYLKAEIKEPIDIITIGDSFLNGGGNGYCQDYLTDKYGMRVLNVQGEFLEIIAAMKTSDWLNELMPKAIVVESVGRAVQWRLGRTELVPRKISRQDIEASVLRENVTSRRISSGIFPPVMTKACFVFLHNQLPRLYSTGERLTPEIYIADLNRNLFSNTKHENTLLFLGEDLNYLGGSVNAEMINKNMNTASKILNDRNIKLIFMPCVDKYDLYYSYIKDKKGRPENPMFEKIRNVSGKEYIFIDTKAILREALARGEKDLYWLGDTHWSWKGFELVCDELVKYLQP